MRAGCSKRPDWATSFVPMPVEVTADTVLGGRLLLKQPRRGHRVGHDAILLAAACPARARERVVDLGAGVGAAGLALAQRVDDSRVTLVEIDPGLAALAAENAQANGLAGRVSAVVLDVTAPARQRAAPDRQRRLAHAGPDGTLAAWIKTAARLLRPGGTLTLIWRADGLAAVLKALDAAFGAVTVFPIHSRAGEPAIRVLVRAAKSSRVPLALLPGLVLNDSAGVPTAQAEAVLRGGAVLPLGQI